MFCWPSLRWLSLLKMTLMSRWETSEILCARGEIVAYTPTHKTQHVTVKYTDGSWDHQLTLSRYNTNGDAPPGSWAYVRPAIFICVAYIKISIVFRSNYDNTTQLYSDCECG